MILSRGSTKASVPRPSRHELSRMLRVQPDGVLDPAKRKPYHWWTLKHPTLLLVKVINASADIGSIGRKQRQADFVPKKESRAPTSLMVDDALGTQTMEHLIRDHVNREAAGQDTRYRAPRMDAGTTPHGRLTV